MLRSKYFRRIRTLNSEPADVSSLILDLSKKLNSITPNGISKENPSNSATISNPRAPPSLLQTPTQTVNPASNRIEIDLDRLLAKKHKLKLNSLKTTLVFLILRSFYELARKTNLSHFAVQQIQLDLFFLH